MAMGMDRRVKEDLAVGIAWIGHTLDPEYQPHKEIIEEKIDYKGDGASSDSEAGDPSSMYPWFELTYYGEPICLNEHLCELAAFEHVHVLHLDDVQQDLGLMITKDHVKSDKKKQDLALGER